MKPLIKKALGVLGVFILFLCSYSESMSMNIDKNSDISTATITEDVSRSLTVLISTSSLNSDLPTIKRMPYRGLVESISARGVVSGWVFDTTASSSPLNIEIYSDDVLIGTSTTQLVRSVLNRNWHIEGAHGFSYKIPDQILDNKTHSVAVKVAKTDIEIKRASTVTEKVTLLAPLAVFWSDTKISAGIPDLEIKKSTGEYVLFGNRSQAAWFPGTGLVRQIIACKSTDGGQHWSDIGVIATAPRGTDLGDGSMAYNPRNQTLYFAYRYNQASTTVDSYFSVRLKQSTDFGQTWTNFGAGTSTSIIKEYTVSVASTTLSARNGLWTPQVFFNSAGDLMYNYDDSIYSDAYYKRLNGGQLAMLTTWDPVAESWSVPKIIAQAPSGRIDAPGARTQIDLGNGHLWSPVESSVDGPMVRSLMLRFTESFDDGRTWSLTIDEMAKKKIVSRNWAQGVKDATVLFDLPPKGKNRSGQTGFYDWSWPLAVRLVKNPDVANQDQSAIFVAFRSDEELPYILDGSIKNNSYNIDKKIFYLLSTDSGRTWIKGGVSDVPAIDHRPVALHDGSVLVGYSLKSAPQTYVVQKGCFTNSCSWND